MKKILSLLLCLPMLLVSLFMANAEELNSYEIHMKDNSNNEIAHNTLDYDTSQEEIYRNTIGVILNSRETLGEIYAGYSLKLDENVNKNEEYTFTVKGLPNDEKMMLFHILDVDNLMTEQILYERSEEGITFKSKPNSLFFFIHVDEIEESYDEEIMLLSDDLNTVSQDFSYKGYVEEFTAPCSTTYKLEVWGGEGGKDRQHEAAGGRIMDGGKGGYSSGEVVLQKGQKLYIAVGGAGESFAFNNSGGGWNGGGNAGGDLSSGGGGGATHISTTNRGVLQNYNDNRDEILIVAGGGGGGGYFSTGGNGGGLTAESDSSGRSKGGAAGFGAGQCRKETDDGAGAGGGWTGGKVYVDSNDYGAGGGTGYIGNMLNAVSTIGVNSGNGRARITWTNEVTVTINYIDKDTNEIVAESYSECLMPESTYSVSSPIIDNYVLDDETQNTISGVASNDTIVYVYYKKLPELTKTIQVNNKDVSNKFIQNGQEVIYILEIENSLNRECTYTVVDEIPEGLEVVSIGQNGEMNKKTITWKLQLPANGKGNVSFVAKPTQDGLVIQNKASYTMDNKKKESNVITNFTPVKPNKIVKNDANEMIDGEIISRNQTLNYSIHLKNNAFSEKEFKVEDMIQDGLEISSISDGGILSDNTITWNIKLNANEEKDLTFKANVIDDKLVEISNSVKQTVDNTCIESNTVKNYVISNPIKMVQNENGESIDNELINSNTFIKYVISITNPSKTNKVFTITDKLPENFEVTSLKDGAINTDGTITLEKEISAKETYDFVIEGKVNKETSKYTNSANVSVDHISLDTNTVNIWTMKTPIKNVFDENGKEIQNELIFAGENRKLTYKIEINNPSEIEKEFVIKDTLSKTLLFDSASDNGIYDSGVITWKLILNPNETKTVEFVVTPNDEYVGEKIINTANIFVDHVSSKTNAVTNYFDDKPEKVQVKGTVEWDDSNNVDKIRPGAITIRLYADGKEVRNQKVISDSDGKMNFSFEQVQKYFKGKEIEYTVLEDEISGYSTVITTEGKNVFKVLNTHKLGEKVKKITSTPTPTSTPKAIFETSTTKVAPNTGDNYSPYLPATTLFVSLTLGIIAFFSLRKWK